jgi:sucrose-6-phosphate hydrolase SacC (GH32 family)
LRLVQQPIEGLGQFTKSIYYAENLGIARANEQLAALKMDMPQEIRVQFNPGTVAEFGLKLCTGDGEESIIGYDVRSQELFVDRQRAGDNSFSDQFAGVHRAPLASQGGKISLHIFLDSCSIEVFANGGSTVISDLIFPQSQDIKVEFYGDARLDFLDICSLSHRS